MTIASLLNQTVVILHRSASDVLDEAGDATEEEVAVQTFANLQPRHTDEQTGHPDIAESDWIGFFYPFDAESLDSASLVWVPDLGEFDIVGSPPTWVNPRTSVQTYVEVNLKRVAGASDSEGS